MDNSVINILISNTTKWKVVEGKDISRSHGSIINYIIEKYDIKLNNFLVYPYNHNREQFVINFEVYEYGNTPTTDHYFVLCKDRADLNYFKLLHADKMSISVMEICI